MNVSLQYALRKRDLAFLHRDFKENYNDYIVSNITDVIKVGFNPLYNTKCGDSSGSSDSSLFVKVDGPDLTGM